MKSGEEREGILPFLCLFDELLGRELSDLLVSRIHSSKKEKKMNRKSNVMGKQDPEQ